MICMVEMRRLTQLVALAVALVLAGQLTLAEAPCALWLHAGGDRTPGCCIMAGGPGGPRAHAGCHGSTRSDLPTSACNRSGCTMATPRAVNLTTPKAKADRVADIVVISQIPVSSASVLTARYVESGSAPGPSKHLLFQVFRI